MSSRGLRVAVLAAATAMAVTAAACSETRSATDEAGSETTAAEPANPPPATTGTSLPLTGAGPGSAAPSSAEKTGPGNGHVPPPVGGSGRGPAGIQVRRELTYILERDDEVFGPGPIYFDAVQEVTDTEVQMTWRMGRNEHREVRRLAVHDDVLTGHFMPRRSVEWSACDWSPPAVYVPPLRLGARLALNTACTMHAGTDSEYRDEMTGEVKVVGTRNVTIDGKQYKTWEIERRWRSVAKGGPNDEAEGWAKTLWSPALQLVVEHEGHAKNIPGGAGDFLEVRAKMRLRGFSHGIFP